MKKERSLKKLVVGTETLRRLQTELLPKVGGGGTVVNGQTCVGCSGLCGETYGCGNGHW